MTSTGRIIEGKWDCTSCGTKAILGRHKECPGCGNPREAGVEMKFDFGEVRSDGSVAAETVTDADALKTAEAGADWFCAFCGTGNSNELKKCGNCGADRSEKKADGPADAGTPAPVSPKSSRSKSGFKVLAVVALLTVGSCIFWGTREHQVAGNVISTSWKRSVSRETFTRGPRQEWRDNIRLGPARMPVNGAGEDPGGENLRACVRKYRRTVKEACGVQQVCRDVSESYGCGSEQKCSVRDKGNGFAEEVCRSVPKTCTRTVQKCANETRYCDRRIDDDWCTFDTWSWVAAAPVGLQGDDSSPRWPEMQAGSLDRLTKQESYEVGVRYGEGEGAKSHALNPATEGEYVRWRKGDTVRVIRNNFGAVTSVEPASK